EGVPGTYSLSMVGAGSFAAERLLDLTPIAAPVGTFIDPAVGVPAAYRDQGANVAPEGAGVLLSGTVPVGTLWSGMYLPMGVQLRDKVELSLKGSVTEGQKVKVVVKNGASTVTTEYINPSQLSQTGYGKATIDLGGTQNFDLIEVIVEGVSGSYNLSVVGASTIPVETQLALVAPPAGATGSFNDNALGSPFSFPGTVFDAATNAINIVGSLTTLNGWTGFGYAFNNDQTIAGGFVDLLLKGSVTSGQRLKVEVERASGVKYTTYIDASQLSNEYKLARVALPEDVDDARSVNLIVEAAQHTGPVNLTVAGMGVYTAPLVIAGTPAAIKESKKGAKVAATKELQDRMAQVNDRMKLLLADPMKLGQYVNLEKLVQEHADYKGLSVVDAAKKLAAAMLAGTYADAYYEGYTVTNRLLSEADLKAGAVEFGADMVLKAAPELVAELKVHELLHLAMKDASHEYIYEGDQAKEGAGAVSAKKLRDALLTVHVTESTAAGVVKAGAAAALRDMKAAAKAHADAKKQVDMDAVRAAVKAAAKPQRPTVFVVTADPDNMMGIDGVIADIEKSGAKDVKIVFAYNDNYTWTGDMREKLMKKHKDIVAGFMSKHELEELAKSGNLPVEEAIVTLVGKKLKENKMAVKGLSVMDIGFIGSAEGAYKDAEGKALDFSVVKGLKRIPVVQSGRKTDDEFHPIGALMEAAELMVMAHRIAGDVDLSAMTFKELADKLPNGAEFLNMVEALGMTQTDAVAKGLGALPPTTKGVTGELQNSINSLRSTLIAA
ncbi:MAG TPA: hypothetical protein P5287_02680, partial [bacterium]|nr:hypothetical protein [bacterium]